MPEKPLGHRAYGHIPHLPNSRLGPGDHKVSSGQARICTEKARDKHDTIIVQEKLDGSNVAVARVNNEIIPLGRAGYRASTSRFEQHHFFAKWVYSQLDRFEWLEEGERIIGEWLSQAHGTLYELPHEPFVPFDVMKKQDRSPYGDFIDRIKQSGFVSPKLLHMGLAFSVEDCLKILEPSGHGAIDSVEGAVWRVERKGKVDFLAKYVRPGKVDGKYLPEVSGKDAVWHWRP